MRLYYSETLRERNYRLLDNPMTAVKEDLAKSLSGSAKPNTQECIVKVGSNQDLDRRRG